MHFVPPDPETKDRRSSVCLSPPLGQINEIIIVYLKAKNAEDDEEGAADEDDVADWSQRRQ